MSDTYNSNNMLPQSVTVEDSKGSRESDIITQQFSKGRLFMMGTIDQKMSMGFISAMLVLAEQHKDAEIFTDSQGGKVSAGLDDDF